MWLFIIFLTTVVHTFDFDASDTDALDEWDSTESLTLSADDYDTDAFMPAFRSGSPAPTLPAALKLPESVRIPASQLRKDLFTPGKGTKPVSAEVKAILLPVSPAAQAPGGGGVKRVEVLCHLDRMYVRVLKSVFTDANAWKNLKLGKCAVNKATKSHYYFLYYLKGCGIRRGEDASRVIYTNILHYKPPVTGLIVRELPFTIPIRCSYAKFRRSYKVGFWPKMAGGTFYRGLPSKAVPSLTAMDPVSWQLLPVGSSFSLGQPVCFEAKGPSSGARRMYLNRCFVTSSPNPSSTDLYVVVANSGCLVDSKNSPLSKFYTTTDKANVRFCLAAFLFENMVSKTQTQKTMFMHCELFLEAKEPTPSSKSCTYNLQSETWSELYGANSVCDCCESTCPTHKSSGKSIITSKSWDLKLGREPSAAVEPMPEFSVAGHDDFELFWESNEY